jgi:hypothetical protein
LWINIIIRNTYRKIKLADKFMMQLPEQCPFCHTAITTIKQYTCNSCGVTFDGHFALPEAGHPLSRLSRSQLDFVLAFVRSEGKLNRLEAELGLSYPTVRQRLHEVMMALSGQPPPESESAAGLPSDEPGPAPVSDEQNRAPRSRKQILDDLAAGRLSPEEAMKLLRSLQ